MGCIIGRKPRYKIRLVLGDKGVSIRESETVAKFLIRLYDSIEVAECLYLLWLLRRDHSLNNVLFREARIAEELRESPFCSARYLLNLAEDRLETEVLLIDFEHATDRRDQETWESAGTPLYLARAANQVSPLLIKPTVVPGMPELIPGALERYREALPKRLKQFPPDKTRHILDMPPGEDLREWFHELRHDIESSFWMLLLAFVRSVRCRSSFTCDVSGI